MAGRMRALRPYALWYLAGILAAILLTPVGLMLLGVHLWPYYLASPGLGFVLFYVLTPEYVLGDTQLYRIIYTCGIAGLALGLATLLPVARGLRIIRPPLIGLSLGFIGAMGIFYTAAASV